MNVQVFQHVPFEHLGSVAAWLQHRGAGVRTTRFFAGDLPPALDDVDLLIALGGPMSVHDEAALPWLKGEKQTIREAIARGIPVLGVCLGAQLIASALGSRVARNPQKEIGWFPLQGVTPPAPPSRTAPATEVFQFPRACTAFHWHGETFDLPAGAVRLAESEACTNQAFQLQRHVIGLQFHLEMTPEGAAELVDHCRGELAPGRFVQSEAEILAAPRSLHQAANALMDEVLEFLLGARDGRFERAPRLDSSSAPHTEGRKAPA